jgi:acyl-CoA dehydrogenase
MLVEAEQELTNFAQAKVLVPQMALTVIDRAVQVHGAMGVCQDTPLANMWAHVSSYPPRPVTTNNTDLQFQIRTLRIADGPDEAHLQQLGKRENKERKDDIIAKFARQSETTEKLFKQMGLTPYLLGAEKFRSKL